MGSYEKTVPTNGIEEHRHSQYRDSSQNMAICSFQKNLDEKMTPVDLTSRVHYSSHEYVPQWTEALLQEEEEQQHTEHIEEGPRELEPHYRLQKAGLLWAHQNSTAGMGRHQQADSGQGMSGQWEQVDLLQGRAGAAAELDLVRDSGSVPPSSAKKFWYSSSIFLPVVFFTGQSIVGCPPSPQILHSTSLLNVVRREGHESWRCPGSPHNLQYSSSLIVPFSAASSLSCCLLCSLRTSSTGCRSFSSIPTAASSSGEGDLAPSGLSSKAVPDCNFRVISSNLLLRAWISGSNSIPPVSSFMNSGSWTTGLGSSSAHLDFLFLLPFPELSSPVPEALSLGRGSHRDRRFLRLLVSSSPPEKSLSVPLCVLVRQFSDSNGLGKSGFGAGVEVSSAAVAEDTFSDESRGFGVRVRAVIVIREVVAGIRELRLGFRWRIHAVGLKGVVREI
ncbi:arginosuccinate synthase family [Striga asiatica]|uniref:Arginosuccinate synthase family n=1 Tax=Striga asiatica TaxID=4170 RepID=A0A5A7QY56_STRAF|nr:arginosuccinate synthase family [Striga asiatica]